MLFLATSTNARAKYPRTVPLSVVRFIVLIVLDTKGWELYSGGILIALGLQLGRIWECR